MNVQFHQFKFVARKEEMRFMAFCQFDNMIS